MATLFSRIARGEIPSYKIAESEKYYAFLDIYPLVMGHVLVIPKEETDYLFDLSDNELSGIMIFAKTVAEALKITYPKSRVGMAVVGFDVPHAHIHLIPMDSIKDINFNRTRLQFTHEEFQFIAERIARNMNN